MYNRNIFTCEMYFSAHSISDHLERKSHSMQNKKPTTRAKLKAIRVNYRMYHTYHRFKTKLSHSAVSSSRKAFRLCTWISASLTRSSMMRQFLRYHTVKINGMIKPVHTNENPNAPRNHVMVTTAQTNSDRRSCVSSRSFLAWASSASGLFADIFSDELAA